LVAAGAEASTLAPLPVRKLPGVGPVAERRLQAIGILTLGELAGAPARVLEPIFGAYAAGVRERARGRGDSDMGRDRPAFREHDPDGEVLGSISNERTFLADVRAFDATAPRIEGMLCSLCERVCWRARRRGVKARTLTLKLRYADFETLSRSRTVAASASERDLLPVLKGLYREARQRKRAIRLLGVALSNLVLDEQLELFTEDRELRASVDALRERFGFDAVRLGASLK
jgi:DNA polymerase-4